MFSLNNATDKGGAIDYNYLSPVSLNVTFLNNSAEYGPNFSSYAKRIGQVGSHESDNITIDDVGSGIALESPLKLALFDNDDQIMSRNEGSQIIILPKDPSVSKISKINSALVREGIAIFDDLAAIAEPGSQSVEYVASSKAIYKEKISEVFNIDISDKTITMNFRY